MSARKKAVILLSGGLDSATIAAIAKNDGYNLYALSFFYGQRHNIEIERAKKLADTLGVIEHKIANINLRLFGGSALTDNIDVPKGGYTDNENDIPVTYVPARNTIFLSYGLAYAEVIGSFDIFIGVNAVDYSGYPDCRPEFIESFEKMANLATAVSVNSKHKLSIHTPLINKTKASIIKLGIDLGVDYSMTLSCYDPDSLGRACSKCDSCQLRLKGFKENGINDPAADH